MRKTNPIKMFSGISLFAGSVWLPPLISELFGISEIFGFVTVGGILAFIAGYIFSAGLRE